MSIVLRLCFLLSNVIHLCIESSHASHNLCIKHIHHLDLHPISVYCVICVVPEITKPISITFGSPISQMANMGSAALTILTPYRKSWTTFTRSRFLDMKTLTYSWAIQLRGNISLKKWWKKDLPCQHLETPSTIQTSITILILKRETI